MGTVDKKGVDECGLRSHTVGNTSGECWQLKATAMQRHPDIMVCFFSFSLDGKRNKKIKDKRMAPPFCPARPLFAGRSAENYFIIPAVSSKVADAEAWYAGTPEALCFILLFLLLQALAGWTKQGAGNITSKGVAGNVKKMVRGDINQGIRMSWFVSFLFPLMEKETKRSRTKEWLRPFVRPAHFLRDGQREIILSFLV